MVTSKRLTSPSQTMEIQGSILGSILFKIVVNDLFFFVHKCELYSYADDNTLSNSDKSLEKVIASLEEDSKELINWFSGISRAD
jgi:hypothetical protein